MEAIKTFFCKKFFLLGFHDILKIIYAKILFHKVLRCQASIKFTLDQIILILFHTTS